MKFLSKEMLKNKNVILRCDFNIPIENGNILDNSKIIKSLKTINYLLENNNRIIILSHFGRIKKEEDKTINSLKPVWNELSKYIEVEFVSNPEKIEEVTNVSNCKCFLVENTRFTDFPKKRESNNDLELAKYWASFGDAFVLDAFGSSHRAHSSTAGIAKYLPTYLGFLMESELTNLEPLLNNNLHPFVVIMGGAKVDDKIKIIESMLTKCDKLILTGGILNTFLHVSKKNVGNSIASNDPEIIKSVKNVLSKYNKKLYFSDKFIVKRNEDILELKIDEIQDNDIIYDNIPNCTKVLKESKIVFLNGTCGMYEDSNYEKGTIKLLSELSNSDSLVYIGGGDTISAVNKFGFNNAYKYLSSGGGATLEYVAYGKLKALEWIKENSVDN